MCIPGKLYAALLTLCGLFVTRTLKCRYYYYYFKLYNITTLVAKCRIDSFIGLEGPEVCHMFLLNVEFSNACRFRAFQYHFDRLAFSIPAFSGEGREREGPPPLSWIRLRRAHALQYKTTLFLIISCVERRAILSVSAQIIS